MKLRYMARFRASLLLSIVVSIAAMGLGGSPAQAQTTVGQYTLTQSYSQNWDSGLTPPALPSGWTAYSSAGTLNSLDWHTTTSNPRSSPNAMAFSRVNAIGIGLNTVAEASANQYAETYIEYPASTAVLELGDVCVRASGTSYATYTGYNARINYLTGAVSISKTVNSSESTLVTGSAATFATSAYYRLRLVAFGTTLFAQVQRASDGFWLNSSGTFVSDATGATIAVTITDSTITAAGYAGLVSNLATGATGFVLTDDFSRGVVTGPTVTASPSSFTQGASATAVTLTGVNTLWTSGTTFSASAGTLTITSVNAGAQTATGTYTPAAGYAQTVTITDSSDVGVGTITVAARAAANWYVNPSTGSDSNPGTLASPWQTMAGLTTGPAGGYAPGDSVLLTGTVTGAGVMTQSGIFGSPITITSLSPGSPATVSCGDGTGITLQDCNYVTVSNLKFAGSGVSSSGVTTSTGYGVYLLADTTGQTYSGLSVVGCDISGTFRGVGIRSTNGTTSLSGFASPRVTGCTVHEVQDAGIWSSARGGGSTHVIKSLYVADCEVYHSYGNSANTTSSSGNGIMLADVNGGLVERCRAHDSGQINAWATGGPVGIWYYESTSSTIQYCESYNNHTAQLVDGCGFDLDGGSQSCVIQYCYSHDNDGGGYIVGQYSGSDATSGNTVRYCLSQNDARTNEAAFQPFAGGSSNVFLGCTVYMDKSLYAGAPSAFTASGVNAGYSVINCAFYLVNGAAMFGASGTGFVFAGNDYWFGGAPFSVVYNGTTYTSLSAWRAATGQETLGGSPVGLYAAPLFPAPGGAGTLAPGQTPTLIAAYNPPSNSPLVDAGVDPSLVASTISRPTIDFHSAPVRPRGAYSVGAVEYPVGGYSTGGVGDISAAVLAGLADVGLTTSRPWSGPAGHIGTGLTGGTAGETDAGILSVLSALAQVGLSPNTPYTGPAGTNK